MADVSTWSTTAASNNSASPDGWPENMLPSGVNNSARENMAQIATWRQKLGGWMLENIGLTATVGSGNLTITLRVKNGSSSPSSTNKVGIGFRNATLTTGGFSYVEATSGIDVTVPSGGTLGFANGATGYVFVYAINNAGTMELAVAGQSVFDEGIVHSTTGVGTGSDSANVLYSTTNRANVPVRLIGRITIQHGTDTWSNSPTVIALWSPENIGTFAIDGTAYTVGSQATQETGTSLTDIVVTGRQHYHQSAAKCWGKVEYSGGTPSAVASYNVSSITDTGTGLCTVNIGTDFSSSDYAVLATVSEASSAGKIVRVGTIAAGSFLVNQTDIDFTGGVLVSEDTDFSFVCFGDQ